VSGDDVVPARDVVIVRNQILAGTYPIWADVDGNGVVDLTDDKNVHKRVGSHLP
jgi:hypothetical protein